MLSGVVRLFQLLVVLTVITYSACGSSSSGLITINLSLPTNLSVFSDIIDINIFQTGGPSHELDSNTIEQAVPEQYNEVKIPDYSIQWSNNMNNITHVYKAVIAPGITWTQARDAAITEGGHLVTITSKEENELVFSYIKNASFWSPCRGNIFGPWLGGYQPSGSDNSSAGWAWVTGEKWEYTNWFAEEPNDYRGEEDRLFFYMNNCTPSATWGDHRNDGDGNTAYIIEWENPNNSPHLVL